MAKIQIKNSFITSSADITISSSMVKFSSGISAKNITGSFSGSIPALTSYYKQGGNSFGTTAILGTNDNQALTFETNNSEKVRIATDGNVGIGTTSTGAPLTVYRASNPWIYLNGGGNFSYIRFNDGTSNAYLFKNTNSDTTNGALAGAMYTYTESGKAFQHIHAGTPLFTILSGGNVGIGTTSPADKLHVIGNVRINGGDILNWSGQAFIQTLGNYDMFFRPNSTLQMILTGNGNIGIGSGFTNPLAKLHVSGSSTSVSAIFNGNVGIGTTSSTSKLHISNTAAATRITITDDVSNGRSGYIESNYSDALVIGTTSGVRSIRFAPDNSTAMTIAVGTNNVGIGTTNPTQRLDLSGSLRIRSSGTYSDPTDNAGFINYDSQGGLFTISARSNGGSTYMAFRTSNSGTGGERMRIINDGNVGIGTSSPLSLLDVRSGYVTAGTGVSTSGTTILAGYYTSGHLTVLGTEQSSGGPVLGYAVTPSTSTTGAFLSSTTITIPRSAYTQDGGTHRWFTGPSQTVAIGSAVTTSEKMRLDTNGNLGIGTSSPATLLHVDTSGADARIRVSAGTNTVQGGMIANSGTSLVYAGSITNHGFSLRTNDTDRVRIDTNGNVGIGTTTAATKFVVAADATDSDVGQLRVIGSTSNAKMTNVGYHTTNNYGFIQALIAGTGYSPLSIQPNGGNVGIGTTAPGKKLDVVGTTETSIRVADTGGSSLELYQQATDSYLLTTNALRIYTSGSARMSILNNGNVGIGTTSPFSKLDVRGNLYVNYGSNGTGYIQTNGSDSDLQITIATNLTTLMNTGGSGAMAFGAGNSERMRITSGGNVGIGTSSPSARLHVTGSSSIPAGIFMGNVGVGTTTPLGGLHINNAQGNFSEVLRLQRNGGIFYSVGLDTNFLNIAYNGNTNASNIFVLKTNGFLGLGNLQTANYNLDIASTQAQGIQLRFDTSTNYLARITPYWNSNTDSRIDFAINRSGGVTPDVIMSVGYGTNVGIGTTSPATKLDLKGNLFVANAANGNNTIAFGNIGTLGPLNGAPNNLTGSAFLVVSSSTASGAPSHMKFFTTTGGTCGERMRIAADGNVGIGTTGPGAKLDVNGDIYARSGYGVYSNIIGPYTGDLTFYTSGTEKMRILSSGGNVGIGTTSPASLLQVGGSSGATATPTAITFDNTFRNAVGGNTSLKIYLYKSGGETYGFGLNNAGGIEYHVGASGGGSAYHAFYTETTEKVRINSAGNLGIGTTSPTARLHISSSSNDGLAQFKIEGVNAPSTFNWASTFINSALGSSRNYISLIGQALSSRNSGYIGFNHSGTTGSTSNFLTFGLYGVDNILNINGSGNVGIGTTSPNAKLQVVGNVRATSFTGSFSGSVVGSNMFVQGGNSFGTTAILGTSDNQALILETNNSEKLRITTAGNVGIGSSSPTAKLDIVGTNTTIALSFGTTVPNNPLFINTYGGAQGIGMDSADAGIRLAGDYAGGGNRLVDIGYYSSGTIAHANWVSRLRVLNNGNVGIGTTSPTAKLHVEGLSFFNNTISSSNKLVVESTQPGIILRETDQSGTTHRWIDVESGIFRILQTNNDYSSFVTQFVINSSGNVGIGTTSPAHKLEVYNSANSATYVRINNQNSGSSAYTGLDLQSYGGGWQVRVPASTIFANSLQFSFNDAEKARITYDGNLGIGVTSPTSRLHISSSSAADEVILGTVGSDQIVGGRTGGSFGISTKSTSNGNLILTANSAMYLRTGGSNDRLFIKSDGNVGIGTTSPSYKLEVAGTLKTTSTITNDGGIYYGGGSNLDINQYNNGYMRFLTNNNEKMRIAADGNVGIGTSSPIFKLDVNGTSGFRDTMAFGPSIGLISWGSMGGGTGFGIRGESGRALSLGSNGSWDYLVINTSGNVGIGTTSPISKLNTYASGSNLSVFKVDGGNGTLFEVTDQLSGSLFSVNDVSGLPLLEVFSNNRIVAGKYGSNALVISGSSVGIGTTTPAYKLQVNGSFGATTKSFVIDHPTKEGKKLVYGSLESPYHGIRLTGRNMLIDGECKVQLPDYIYKLARPESVNIQITPIKCGKVIYVDEISVENNYFVVKYDKSLLESYKNYEFFWDFTATRSDVDELTVEQ